MAGRNTKLTKANFAVRTRVLKLAQIESSNAGDYSTHGQKWLNNICFCTQFGSASLRKTRRQRLLSPTLSAFSQLKRLFLSFFYVFQLVK